MSAHSKNPLIKDGSREARAKTARRPRRNILGVCLAAAMVLGACTSQAATPISAPATTNPGHPTTAADVANALSGVGGWPWFGYDDNNSRYNKREKIINTENVGGLVERWHIDGIKGVSSTPAVEAGVVYFGDWNGVAHAVAISDGKEIWRSELANQFVMSSPTIDGDGIYIATNSKLFKLDKATGKQLWSVTTSTNLIAITPASPLVVDGQVILGVASGELMVKMDKYSFRGSVTSYSTTDGAMTWQYWLTKGDETEGAGVGVWSTPSIDRKRGIIYVGSGNTYEPPASKMADSIIALEYKTGTLKWSKQFTYPDVWSTGHIPSDPQSRAGGLDADVGAGPNLWTQKGKDFVGAGDKTGSYHALDRDTGELVWETKMTSGSALGGVIGTSAVDATQIYVGSNEGDPATNTPIGKTKIVALNRDDGKIVWSVELDGATYAPITTAGGVVYAGLTSGAMYAFDGKDGKQLWTFMAADQVGGGATVVDGTVLWGWGFALFGSGSGAGGIYAFRPGGGSGTGSTTAATIKDETEGARLFRTVCSSCHGRKGEGGVGPSLVGVADRMPLEDHLNTVRNGRGPSQMPAFKNALTDDEIKAVVEYERTKL